MANETELSRTEAFQRSDDVPSNPTSNPTIGDVLAARFGRRDLLKGLLGTTVVAGLATIYARSPVTDDGLMKWKIP